jgi:hypothetical protein
VVSGVELSPPPPPQAVRLSKHKIRKALFMIIKFVFNMVYDRGKRSSIRAVIDIVPAAYIA